MTESKKNRLYGVLYSIVGGVAVGVVMLGIQGFSSDSRSLKKEVIRLDKIKADITVVDEKCEKIKIDIQNDRAAIDMRLERLENKTDRILELMINK
jgi:uncharacterized protein (DUF3084 family)